MRSLQSNLARLRRTQWVLAGATLLGLAGFYVAVFRPFAGRLDVLTLQIQQKRRELEGSTDKTRQLPILMGQVRDLEVKVQHFERQFPRQPALDLFIRNITDVSQRMNLREWRYQPGAPRRGDAFQELPIQMQFQGDFLAVASFLREVENMPRLTRVKKLSVKAKDGTTGLVEVELSMNIYFSEH
jgi:Tfp pilus assembly protein PilO